MSKNKMPKGPFARRFRLKLDCGHEHYLDKSSATYPVDLPVTDTIICRGHAEVTVARVTGMTEVPAIEPTVRCRSCELHGRPFEVAEAETDHPLVTYRCANEHTWDVQF